jgi:hypothetical protein
MLAMDENDVGPNKSLLLLIWRFPGPRFDLPVKGSKPFVTIGLRIFITWVGFASVNLAGKSGCAWRVSAAVLLGLKGCGKSF